MLCIFGLQSIYGLLLWTIIAINLKNESKNKKKKILKKMKVIMLRYIYNVCCKVALMSQFKGTHDICAFRYPQTFHQIPVWNSIPVT